MRRRLPGQGRDRTRSTRRSTWQPQAPLRDAERDNYDFFLDLPELDRDALSHDSIKGSQVLEPLFEYSGACAGCGETPYIKLLTQLFGDRLLMANATGCSSIYGGNLPTTPCTTNRDGRGPAWSNSLFEDNAEFGLGMRLGARRARRRPRAACVERLAPQIGDGLVDALLDADQSTEAGHRGPARAGRARCEQQLARTRRPPRRGASRRSPTTW